MITWLASYPRSGNSLCRRVLEGYFGITSTSIYSEEPNHELKPYIERDPPSLAEMTKADRHYWVKTHQPPDEETHPAICMVRDGRDALVSYTRIALEGGHFPSDADHETNFRTAMYNLIVGQSPFLTWSENVLAWRQRPRTSWVRFEDLIVRPAEVVEQSLRALGVPFQRRAQPQCLALSELRQLAPNRYRQGKPGGWRTEMPADLEALFWQRHGHAMEAFDYPR